MQKVKILGVGGSPRKNGNTTKMVNKALEGAGSVPGVQTELYEMGGKKIGFCISCYKCLEKGYCVLKDDFHEFVPKYMEADGVLWGAPVYHTSIPASMKALLDRLGNMSLLHYLGRGKLVPRFNKVCGVLTGGASRYGGQELTLTALIHSCLLMNGIVVPGDNMTGCYIGAAAWTGQGPDPLGKDNIDPEGMVSAQNVGKRVAEMTRIVKAGMTAIAKDLPEEYFYSWEQPTGS
jgi:multimeric flavodoxin WrbA